MRPLVYSVLVLVFCSVGCSPERSASPGNIAENQSTAANSVAVTDRTTSVRTLYNEWSVVARADVEENFAFFNHVMENEPGQFHFEIGECSQQEGAGTIDPLASATDSNTESPPYTSEQVVEGEIRSLARRMASWRISLVRGGYPEHIWTEPLRRYEDATLEQLGRRPAENEENERSPEELAALDFSRVAAQIESGRAVAAPQLPRLTMFAGCAGSAVAIWRTSPRGGRVWLIDTMDFRYCDRRFGDGYDLSRCTRWEEIGADQEVQAEGVYVVQARWPNGTAGSARSTVIADARLPSP